MVYINILLYINITTKSKIEKPTEEVEKEENLLSRENEVIKAFI